MAVKVDMPKLSDTMEEGVILKWRKKEGETIKAGEILCDVQSDKADMELESYETGTVLKLFAAEGQPIKVGTSMYIIGKTGEDISSLLSSAPSAQVKKEETKKEINVESAASVSSPAILSDSKIKASPLAKKIAQANKVELTSVIGSGPMGRIVKKDIEEALLQTSASSARPIIAGKTVEVPLSQMRKAIAKRLVESKATAPHFYITSEVNMKQAIAFRTSLNESGDYKISYNDIIIKAVASTLHKHPKVNATFAGDKIIQHGAIHVGVAVAIEDGLITPVVRNADMKGLAEISSEVKGLAVKAREKKLKPEEFQGSTFTISNLGMFDVDNFSAIINPPEGAILAVGSIVEKPVVENGTIVVGNTLKMTLSCDHRVIDGAVAAQFMQELKKFIEHPVLLCKI